MSDRQIKRQALSLLKKARRWFNSEDRLVKDWRHVIENKQGESVTAYDPGACRACVLGGVDLVSANNFDHDTWIKARTSLGSSRRARYLKRHTLAQVRRIYDRAIARLEKELQR